MTTTLPRDLRGFTLVELSVVLGILLILGFIAINSYYSSMATSSNNSAFNRIATAAEAVQASHVTQRASTFTIDSVTDTIRHTFSPAGNKTADELVPTTFLHANSTSAEFTQWAIGFDNDDHVVHSSSGSRAVIYARAPTGRALIAVLTPIDTHSTVLQKPLVCFVTDTAPTTPADYLTAPNPSAFCASDT